VTDAECLEVLRWAAPRLGPRWEGFRRVRGQVCKRMGRRMKALGLESVAAWRERLEADPAEWAVLAGLEERLVPGGLLALGAHESLPEGASGFSPAAGALPLFRRE
jgi:chemotaxis methyl-accepting protein methylase